MSLLNSYLHQQTTVFSLLTTTSAATPLSKPYRHQILTFLRRPTTSSLQSSFQTHPQQRLYGSDDEEEEYDEEDEQVIGDCLVFEEGIFEDPYLQQSFEIEHTPVNKPLKKGKKKPPKKIEVKPENLIPEDWKEIQEELHVTKKERKKIAQELEFGKRLERNRLGLQPIPEEYKAAELRGFKPLVSVNPAEFPLKEDKTLAAEVRELRPFVSDDPVKIFKEGEIDEKGIGGKVDEGKVESRGSRVAPRNPKMAVYGRSLEDISEFFNSGRYDPEAPKNSRVYPKLFTKEEKVLMNKRVPDLKTATSEKWNPLHTVAASGDFYLLETLFKFIVNINVFNKDGLTAIHKAILGKKHAICNFLLRNSTNPFVLDKDGATLVHYAVITGSTQMIKVLLLYNVDINLQDNNGWTPLHLAVQSRRTDVVRLLLIKGADKTLKNQDGLTPLDLCLYSGRDTRTYELIRLLKMSPKPRKQLLQYNHDVTSKNSSFIHS